VAAGEGGEGAETYVNELIWREFYMQILWHWPHVLDADFNPECRTVRWYEPGADFAAWREGRTGFPIVDAAMRQLNATGFMHNRLRMITAMFLTKDLHLHWRLGERYFMRRLVDGEIASNNGGWQWSAGTGADAAPYFRIQNPWTQSARFDPSGEFIKQWVPELRDAHPAAFARAPEPGMRIRAGYPLPIVDHARERETALKLFRQR
jgi:deoxyribodipyrimidine photo-lyase